MRFVICLIVLLALTPALRADEREALCPAAGYGFLRVAGSTLCVAPRGFVRAEFLAAFRLQPHTQHSDAKSGSITKTQFGLDFVDTDSGGLNYGRVRFAIARENGVAAVWTDGLGGQRTLTDLDEAWVRMGPFMAGRGPSRFDFYRDAFNYTPLPVSDLTANFVSVRIPLLANVQAELALEDGYERANGWASPATVFNKPDLVGVLRAAIPGRIPMELNASLALPQISNRLYAVQAGAAMDFGGERPHLFIIQGGFGRGPPSFFGLDRGQIQAITGADLSIIQRPVPRMASGIGVYRRPGWNEHWTITSFGGIGLVKPALGFATGETGYAAMMMVGGNIEWRSRQGLMIGGEVAYVKSQTPATPYTRYGEGLIYRLRIERGF